MKDLGLIKQRLSAALNARKRNNTENKVNCVGISVLEVIEWLEETRGGHEINDSNSEDSGS